MLLHHAAVLASLSSAALTSARQGLPYPIEPASVDTS